MAAYEGRNHVSPSGINTPSRENVDANSGSVASHEPASEGGDASSRERYCDQLAPEVTHIIQVLAHRHPVPRQPHARLHDLSPRHLSIAVMQGLEAAYFARNADRAPAMTCRCGAVEFRRRGFLIASAVSSYLGRTGAVTLKSRLFTPSGVRTIANPPPPTQEWYGFSVPTASAAAIHASTAFPPADRIAAPMLDARVCSEAMAPFIGASGVGIGMKRWQFRRRDADTYGSRFKMSESDKSGGQLEG